MLTNDGQALAFFNMQLTHIEAAIYKKQYPEKVWDKIIPIDTSVDPLAKTVTYYVGDRTGEAKLGANLLADDIPIVNVNRGKNEVPIIEGTVGYRYSIIEVMQARKLGINLAADEAMAARDAFEDTMETLALSGFALSGMSGLLNFPGITTVAAPNGAAASPLWANKTADEIVADINSLLSGVHSTSNTVEMADNILLPVDSHLLISYKRVTDTSMTILQYIEKANIYTAKTGRPLTITTLRQLGTAGGSGSKRMVAYKKDPDVLKMHLPMPLRFEAPQQRNFAFTVPGMWRTGGLNVRRPGAMRYYDGI